MINGCDEIRYSREERETEEVMRGLRGRGGGCSGEERTGESSFEICRLFILKKKGPHCFVRVPKPSPL